MGIRVDGRIVVDRREIPRVHCSRIPLVPRDLRQISLPYPTRRLDPLFRTCVLWRHIHRLRRWLQPTSRPSPQLSCLGTKHSPNRCQQRCHGLRTSTPFLPPRNRITVVIQPQLGDAIHLSNVQHRPTLPIRNLERIHPCLQTCRRACKDSYAR
jgi:hypothetical protein